MKSGPAGEGGEETSSSDARRRRPRRVYLFSAATVAVLLTSGAVLADWWIALPDDVRPGYVGRETCAQCHADQLRRWHGSHHDLAMDRATDETVLGDFDDATLTHFGITSRMFRRDGKYFVHTEGPDGEMDDFHVKYVFGVDPLQQYMVEFDRPADMPENEIARLQVLRISWDVKRKRWFFLMPTDVDERISAGDDELHWTGITQCWNTSCADCHSTNLRKNYDPVEKVYHTTFSEIDVSCEACHGPGELHVQLAQATSLFWDRRHGYGLAKLKGESSEAQIQTCAACHSRRGVVHPEFRAGEDFHDHYALELLREATYHADGQIKDEDYVYGSFLQSKMYHQGVRCTDCHDPHTARLKHEGNMVCTSCHAHPAGKYDGPAHHFHKPGSSGASCVECHMPETTYMAVDPRRDHSMRVPRPDLSVSLGTPNACTGCHLDESKLSAEKAERLDQYLDWIVAAEAGDEEVAGELRRLDQWSSDRVRSWYGSKTSDSPHFAHVLAGARRGEPESAAGLSELVRDKRIPGIVRATALYELERFPGAKRTLIGCLDDKDPKVRAAAVTGLGIALEDPRDRIKHLLPLCRDPVTLVRIEAGRICASLPDGHLTREQIDARDDALREFEASVRANSDRARAHMALASVRESRGEEREAEKAYRTAIHVEPTVSGARSNLASLLERRAQRAEQGLRSLVDDPRALEAEVARIWGFREETARLRAEELTILRRDARRAENLPASAGVADLQYRLGLACYLNGEWDEAEQALRKAYEMQPQSVDYTMMLALLYERMERRDDAVDFAQRLIELRPDDPTYRNLLHRIRTGEDPAAADSPPH